MEYILKHKPCNLCLLERIPYILGIILVILVSILKKFEKKVFLMLSLIFLISTFLSAYHVGIEKGFFEESLVCNLNNDLNNLNKEDLLKSLNNQTVSCKDVTFRILGFSLATLNTIISMLISIITLTIFLNYEKK